MIPHDDALALGVVTAGARKILTDYRKTCGGMDLQSPEGVELERRIEDLIAAGLVLLISDRAIGSGR